MSSRPARVPEFDVTFYTFLFIETSEFHTTDELNQENLTRFWQDDLHKSFLSSPTLSLTASFKRQFNTLTLYTAATNSNDLYAVKCILSNTVQQFCHACCHVQLNTEAGYTICSHYWTLLMCRFIRLPY